MFDGLKKLFGKDTSQKERRGSSLLDKVGPDHVPDGCIAAIYDLMDSRYPETLRRVRDSIDLRAGKKRAAMHANWSIEDRESLRADGPEKYEEPRRLARRLGSKEARIKRPAAGIEPKAQKESTRIEDWDNAYLDEQYPDMPVTDLLLNEGETVVLQMPAPGHWECIPTLYDEFEEEGKHATEDEYDAVPEHQKHEYERASTNDEKKTYKRLKKRYRVNKDGEGDEGQTDFRVDLKKSTRYYQGEMEDAFARNIPIILRGPLSRLDFVPINPTFKGRGIEVDGIVIRTLYRKSMLARDYRWEGSDNDELLEPVSAWDGNGEGELYLYELWAYDHLRRPYVAYQVGTNGTVHADDGSAAVIKLWEMWPGITELPLAFEYGQHNSGSNQDLRTMPFTQPKMANWLQRDNIVTTLAISTAESGYPTWGQKITKDGIEAMRALGGDYDLQFIMQPNAVQPIFGDLVELTSKGTNNDVKVLLEVLQAFGQEVGGGEGAFGGDTPTSGLDRQVQGRDLEMSYGDVIEGQRRIKEKCGRHALMLASAIGRACDRPVEIYAMTDAQLPAGSGQTTHRKRISLPPDLCGDNWDVIGEFPHQPGENLAGTSLYLTLLEQGAILMREFRELWGDPHPEQFMAEKVLEDYFTKTPAGQLDALMGMAEYIRDQRLKKILDLANQNKLTGAQGGMATAAMDDLMGGEPAGPGQVGGGSATGMALPDRGQAALAGGNAGALAASAAAAGGPFDAVSGGAGALL